MNRQAQIPIDKVRVIGIFAHVDAGKTTTSEAILYYTGRIRRVGNIDEGNTQLDWMTQERERGITVTSAATTCNWQGHRINLIDTPGHIDFAAEVVRSIRVIDGAVIVLCGVGGVEPQTNSVWMHADREGLPRLIFVNKLDRLGADFTRVLGEIREQLTPRAIVLQLPIGREAEFVGMVDVLSRQAYIWKEGSETPASEGVPDSMQDEVEAARAALLEAICETDDELLEQWFEGEEPAIHAVTSALRDAVTTGELIPVLCGSALRRIGIQPLLDSIAAYLPSPLEMPLIRRPGRKAAEKHTVQPDAPEAPFRATAFKIVTDPYVGHLTWVRVLSGRRAVGETVCNPRLSQEERVGRIYRMHANQREQIPEMSASDVVALVGVRSAATGDTLCDPEHPVMLDAFEFPEPVIMVALMPETDELRERMRQAVVRLCNEDPTLTNHLDPDTGEFILAGMGELHLEIVVDRLRTEFDLIPTVSQPLIAYRETIRQSSRATGFYRRQSGGHGHFARVRLLMEPIERGAGVVFKDASPRSEIPEEFVRPTEIGIRELLEKGVIAGYPITDVRVVFLGGRIHEVDSSGKDFQIAGSMAARQAVQRGNPALLEPVMRVDVNVGEEHIGALTGDMGRRRGRVKSIDMHGSLYRLTGQVPLDGVRGYATFLRNLTQGRGTFTLEFRQHDIVPDEIAAEIIQQRRLEGKIPRR